MTGALSIGAAPVSLADCAAVLADPVPLSLSPEALPRIAASRQVVDNVLARGATVYGINTGFGKLARTSIPADRLVELQRALVLSHSAGTGPALDDALVRLILVLKAASLSQGASGVRQEVVEALLALANAGVYPVIPAQGSVGASGDLAPLAHLASVLIGEGEVRHGGQVKPGAEGLVAAGLEPLILAPKEGLALLNGTQVSTAIAVAGLIRLEQCFAAALLAGALSVDAMAGSDVPFRPEIQQLRGQPGQIAVAGILAELLADSPIRASHIDCDRVQDPYSLRCQPQVMGAALDVMEAAAAMLAREAGAVSDNPLVLTATGEIVSGGNFHAEPVAFAADMLALAAAEIGNLSERRTALLIDPGMSGLPAFLARDGGVNSGLMIAQVTTAALASENKTLAHPASVDTIPTSAGQEDHVSMATHGARRLLAMTDNLAGIVAIELIAAVEGLEHRKPLSSSPALEALAAPIREKVPPLLADRPPAPDIEAVRSLIFSPWLVGSIAMRASPSLAVR